MNLYVENATKYIQNRADPDQIPTISRAAFELRVLTQLDISTLHTEYKLTWMNAVGLPIVSCTPTYGAHLARSPYSLVNRFVFSQIMNTDKFDSFWLSQSLVHSLTDTQTQRYVPDPALCTYIVPSTSRANSSPSKRRPSVNGHRSASASHDLYDKATNNGFEELRTMDLGPVDVGEVTGSRKRKKSAKAMAEEDEWEKLGKNPPVRKRMKVVAKKPRLSNLLPADIAREERSDLPPPGTIGSAGKENPVDLVKANEPLRICDVVRAL